MADPPKVFISHSKVNRAEAERLAQLLLANGVPVWYDDWEMLVGHNVYDSVYEAILRCDYLALLITRDALTSSWVKEELGLMRQRQLEERQVRILPLLYDDVELPLNLRGVKYADFRDFDRGFAHLMRTLGQTATLVDEHVLRSVRSAVQKEGLGLVEAAKTIRSQAALRLSRTPRARAASSKPATVSFVSVEIEFTSAGMRLPMRIPLQEPLREAMNRVLRLLDMQGALGNQRLDYFFVRDGKPLASENTAEIAVIRDGDILQVGYYTYAIE
jgi:TIR domain